MQKTATQPITIKVQEKTNYGNTLYYVIDERQRDALYYLTKGQKTLTDRQCNALVELGFNVTVHHHQPFTK
jgi:uncharacterized protein YhbP (UPF0306 family)